MIAALEQLSGNLSEEALDLIDPGRIRRGEVRLESEH